jgi:hypothetical protein
MTVPIIDLRERRLRRLAERLRLDAEPTSFSAIHPEPQATPSMAEVRQLRRHSVVLLDGTAPFNREPA